MAMISDASYVLHAVRLSALRTADDPITPRIITLDSKFALNPYVSAMGLADIDRWPEIKRALDSPVPEPFAQDSDGELPDLRPRNQGATGLRYTQTIVPAGRAGGAGMRVSGRRRIRPGAQRSNSSSADRPPMQMSRVADDVFSPRRQRSDSEPTPLSAPETHVLEKEVPFAPATVAANPIASELSPVPLEVDIASPDLQPPSFPARYDPDGSSMGAAVSQLPSDLAMTVGDADPLPGEAVDEGSDVDEDEVVDEEVPPPVLARRPSHIRNPSAQLVPRANPNQRYSTIEEERRSSADSGIEPELEFGRMTITPPEAPIGTPSGLTALLNQHVPHLVSTGSSDPSSGKMGDQNPFFGLYASVAAPPTVPSITLELFFPHSDNPTEPVTVSVRRDATVEEVTGHGLWKYWDEARTPKLGDDGDESELSSVGWGLRIVEDDGEVDEDFPPLDRESQVSKFSYAQFGIVRATDSQKKQNAAMAPLILRRPSRTVQDLSTRNPQRNGPIVSSPVDEMVPIQTPARVGGLGSKPTLLRVLVRASMDVHFTTTISVPSDMYIADLTEVLVEKKHLQLPVSEWVLCLADLTLALPLDRTVASLEGKTELTLVRRQWAAEHGLRAGNMRGGDPSASIFKRASEPVPLARFGPAGDFSQTYKKFTVMRKTPIGRHERQLAIDGDYIHILPSENRAFFDSMKTTSIHITLIASVKQSGRAGGFKLYVWRDGNRKRYEFEAENGKQAGEIVESIKQMMKIYQTERQSILAPLRQITKR